MTFHTFSMVLLEDWRQGQSLFSTPYQGGSWPPPEFWLCVLLLWLCSDLLTAALASSQGTNSAWSSPAPCMRMARWMTASTTPRMTGPPGTGTAGMGGKQGQSEVLRLGVFRLDTKRNFFTEGEIKHWNGCPGGWWSHHP